MRSEIRGSIRVSAFKAARIRDPKRFKIQEFFGDQFTVYYLKLTATKRCNRTLPAKNSRTRLPVWLLVFEWLGVPFQGDHFHAAARQCSLRASTIFCFRDTRPYVITSICMYTGPKSGPVFPSRFCREGAEGFLFSIRRPDGRWSRRWQASGYRLAVMNSDTSAAEVLHLRLCHGTGPLPCRPAGRIT